MTPLALLGVVWRLVLAITFYLLILFRYIVSTL